jgi:DNA-binding NtrC family response regulator
MNAARGAAVPCHAQLRGGAGGNQSELFVREKGSFSGAASRISAVQQASHGTLFLDEIGDMPLVAAANCCASRRSGRWSGWAATGRSADVRVVVATHRNLDSW